MRLLSFVAPAFAGLGMVACVQRGGPPRPVDADLAPMVPPPVGAPEPMIDNYLEHLRLEVRYTQREMRTASRAGDRETARFLREDLREDKRRYKAERDRLTERDTPLFAAGIATTSAGGAAIVASIGMGLVYGIVSAWGGDDDDLRNAAIGTLAGGLAGVGAGVPMIVVGGTRTPRPEQAPAWSMGQAAPLFAW